MTDETVVSREELALATRPAHTLAIPHEKGTLDDVRERYYRIQHSAFGQGFTQQEIWEMSLYSVMMDLNPFRGETYPVRGKDGKIHMVDGYKALTRWARNSCPYTDNYTALPLGEGERWRIRCTIMREDRLHLIEKYKALGATFAEAFEQVATFADGVVRENETVKRDGTPIEPPKGWTWEQRARIRALKNALNLSHGAPSPREIAEASYVINGTATVLEDWEGTELLKYPEERERLALVRAQDREHRAEWESLSHEEQQQKFKENVDMMRAPADFEGYGDEPSYTALTKEEVEILPDSPGPVKQPPPGTDDQPASQKHAKLANDVGDAWRAAVAEMIEEVGYYVNKDGGPNWHHLTAAAYTMGYPEITAANLKDVIEALALYAEDQQFEARTNEAAPAAELENEKQPSLI